jgi:2-aminomuconate deaminase
MATNDGRRKDAEVIAGRAKPRGAYPHYRRAGDFIFVSGTSSRRADNTIAGAATSSDGSPILDIREQTRAVIENVRAILETAGASLADCVEITTFLIDMKDFLGYNAIYAEYFTPETGPARTTVEVRELPHPLLAIEIRAIAYKPITPS